MTSNTSLLLGLAAVAVGGYFVYKAVKAIKEEEAVNENLLAESDDEPLKEGGVVPPSVSVSEEPVLPVSTTGYSQISSYVPETPSSVVDVVVTGTVNVEGNFSSSFDAGDACVDFAGKGNFRFDNSSVPVDLEAFDRFKGQRFFDLLRSPSKEFKQILIEELLELDLDDDYLVKVLGHIVVCGITIDIDEEFSNIPSEDVTK
jgi:hypothetical protein